SPAPTPTLPDHGTCSPNHHIERGTTHSGVEKASTDERPGGRRVNATAVSAEYTAICRTPETAMSFQSDRDGGVSSPRSATTIPAQAAPTTYRKHANQIGGIVVTPILITGQLAPQIRTRTARSQRARRLGSLILIASAAPPPARDRGVRQRTSRIQRHRQARA